jgi:hypothetical protein
MALASLYSTSTDAIDTLRMAFAHTRPADVRERLDTSLESLRFELKRSEINSLANSSLAKVKEAAAAAAESAEAAAESAGLAGTSKLAEAFTQFAAQETLVERVWRSVSIGVLTGSAIAAYFHLAAVPSLDWIEVARRLALGIPIGTLFFVANHEASVHRTHALWLRHVQVQLQTIRAFTDELPIPQRADLRARFGYVVFSGPPSFDSSSDAMKESKGTPASIDALGGAIAGAVLDRAVKP